MSDPSNGLDRFHHLPFRVEIELGRITLDIETILRLREGDVLRTSQKAGAPARVMVAGVELGSADIVTVKDRAAARIAKISTTTPGAAHGNR